MPLIGTAQDATAGETVVTPNRQHRQYCLAPPIVVSHLLQIAVVRLAHLPLSSQ